jgi:hypothetical protein
MARARTPLAKAEATGRTDVNPARFRDRKEPESRPLGEPSIHLDDLQKCVWEAFKREIPWLMESDRAAVEGACVLRARLWEGCPETKDIAQLRILLSTFGGTPADRSKIVWAQGEADDPADEFIN